MGNILNVHGKSPNDEIFISEDDNYLHFYKRDRSEIKKIVAGHVFHILSIQEKILVSFAVENSKMWQDILSK